MKHLTLALASIAVLGASAHAKAPDVSTLRPMQLEFVAWSTDSAYVLIKVQDKNVPGHIYQVRDAKGEVVRMGNKPAVFPSQHPPLSDEGKKFERDIRSGRRVKIDGKPVVFDQDGIFEAQHPRRTEIMLMTGQKGDKLHIIGMRGERATRYDSLHLVQDKSKVIAKASQKALVWDKDGKNFCLIYNQKLESKDTPFEGDFLICQEFKSFKVKGVEDTGEPEE